MVLCQTGGSTAGPEPGPGSLLTPWSATVFVQTLFFFFSNTDVQTTSLVLLQYFQLPA